MPCGSGGARGSGGGNVGHGAAGSSGFGTGTGGGAGGVNSGGKCKGGGAGMPILWNGVGGVLGSVGVFAFTAVCLECGMGLWGAFLGGVFGVTDPEVVFASAFAGARELDPYGRAWAAAFGMFGAMIL